jgi:hypothetical protein
MQRSKSTAEQQQKAEPVLAQIDLVMKAVQTPAKDGKPVLIDPGSSIAEPWATKGRAWWRTSGFRSCSTQAIEGHRH